MADLILPTINFITNCISTYHDFYAFKDECQTFRRSLGNVVDVLTDIDKGLAKSSGRSITSASRRILASSGGGATNTKLRRPMELLQTAASEGGVVLKKCSAKRQLMAFAFSRQLMGMLNKAKADIEEAMRLLQVSSVKIQVSTRRMMDTVTERLAELDKKIGPSIAGPNEVTELIRAEMKLNRESHSASVAEALSEVLVKMGVVTSRQDCVEQFADLQREADSIRRAKVIYDEEMLEAVKALTAPRDDDASPRQGSERTASAVEQCMVCPISGQIMHDPVTVVESGITYDRESLCTSLLLYPDLEPVTGQRFDHPLLYTPSIAIRNLITAQQGDSHYQKYDDDDFKAQYEVRWKEHLNPSPPVVLVKDSGNSANEGGRDDSWSGFDMWSDFAEPTSATSGDSSSRDVSSGQLVGISGVMSGGARDGSVGSDEKSLPPDATLIQVSTMLSSDNNDDEESGKEGATTTLSEKLQVNWSSRKVRWLIAGAVAVVLVVVVAAAVAASASKPKTESRSGPASSTPSPQTAPSIVEDFNATLPEDTIQSLQDSASPQYRAYEWVTKSDEIPEQDEPDRNRMVFRMKQRFALATFFYSVTGLESRVQSTESECQWGASSDQTEQIICNSGSQIVALKTSSGTGGTLPPEIGLLTDLTSLSVDNGLTSSIPTELGLLTALTYLDIGGVSNALTSSIPTELSKLSNLTYLDLSSNDLTSSIPTELGWLTALENLYLKENKLTSSIPAELGMLAALKSLDLSFNGLTSSIPTELGLPKSLSVLDLYSNKLTSSIPTELGKLSKLRSLDLRVNGLSGTFPSDLCKVNTIDIDCADISCTCCGCST